MIKEKFSYQYLILMFFLFFSCHKFNEITNVGSPSYLRVFNSLTYSFSPRNKDSPAPFLVFLLDPPPPINGVYSNQAKIVGDFIDQRDPFSSSYPSKAGNIGILRNKDWPGKQNVLTAPMINGFDLSAWGEIPSGSHRIVFLGRPQSDTAYANLPPSERTSVIADTMINFIPGGVYTLEAVLFDEYAQKTGVYAREENFTKNSFSADKNYFSFYNLSSKNPVPPTDKPYYFSSSVDLYYTQTTTNCYNTQTNGTIAYDCLNAVKDPSYDQVYFRSVNQLFQQVAPFDSIPIAKQSAFIYPNGNYRATSSLPYHVFQITPQGIYPSVNSFNLVCASSFPNRLPDYFASQQGNVITTPFQILPSFNLITTDGIQNQVFSTVNIIELVNNQAFLMQISRISNPPLISPN